MKLTKYPRTRHLEGSRLQKGDLGDDKPLAELFGKTLIVEEKLDGANCAVSFNKQGELQLQSRGHYLTGGYRERHFDLLKTWASVHSNTFRSVFGARYVMFGEWLYAKHTSYYDALPHFFLEFDLFDRQTSQFLSTDRRKKLLSGLPIMPVPVLHKGEVGSVDEMNALIKPSLYKSAQWREHMEETAKASGNRMEFVERQTEATDLAEGLYVKLEDAECVQERFKFVRDGFIQTLTDSDSHWHSRPILPNQLADGVDIFAPVLGVKGAYDAC
ncbi:RNA ligase family protein [Roseibium sp. HPY-6]|uniref:RNA ligase family protein n=1 Tax=Roseibium sp. HPY-6 TaxID=3229852 RepID=UPI00338F4802